MLWTSKPLCRCLWCWVAFPSSLLCVLHILHSPFKRQFTCYCLLVPPESFHYPLTGAPIILSICSILAPIISPQVVIKYLICARHWVRCWESTVSKLVIKKGIKKKKKRHHAKAFNILHLLVSQISPYFSAVNSMPSTHYVFSLYLLQSVYWFISEFTVCTMAGTQ